MKKNLRLKIFIFIVAAFLLQSYMIPLINASSSNSSLNAKWTLMMYFDGDNKLDAVMEAHLELIRQVEYNSDVQIIVLIDGKTDGDTKLYNVIDNTLVELDWPIESDMDDPATLQQFIQQIKNDFVSDYYGLFIGSNKGSAWQGICYDENGDGTMITMPEFNQVLNIVTNIGGSKLDIISINTCMGGNTEIAYEIREFCKYYIAGPECGITSPYQGIGFPYQNSISDLVSNSDMTPEDFSITCVDNFNPIHDPPTKIKTNLVAVDLSYMETLGSQYNALANFFIDNIDLYRTDIEGALTQTKIFGEMWGINYIIEPYHFLEQLNIENSEFQIIKNQILATIDESIVAKKIFEGDTVYGLNLYLPRNTPDYNHALRYVSGILPSPYEETSFASDIQWDEFLKTFLGIADNRAPNKPTITGLNQGSAGEVYDFSINAVDPDGDMVSFFINWGDGIEKEWFGSYSSGEVITESHSWDEKGTFSVQVKAKDIYGAESEWETFSMSIPKVKHRVFNQNFTFLIGKISDIEEDQQGGIRFLPIRTLKIVIDSDQGYSMEIIDETHGGYPCCSYIYPDDFKGIVRSSFIFGIWII